VVTCFSPWRLTLGFINGNLVTGGPFRLKPPPVSVCDAIAHAPRIPPLSEEEFRSVERKLGLSPTPQALNVMTTLARNPALYKAWQRFAGALFNSELDPRERELVILRSAWRCQSSYEWAQHARIAHQIGLTDTEIRRIAGKPDDPDWAPADALLLRAVDELVDERRLSDATYTALAARYEPARLLLLTMLAGHYVMLAGVLAASGVVPETEDMPRLGEP
jgi:4-carboxymuconolactone decarboxylase